MIVWHLPDDGSDLNAYGRLLVNSLRARDIVVRRKAYRHFFIAEVFREKPDVLHFEFITPYLFPALSHLKYFRICIKGPLFVFQILLLKLMKCRIVWTVHNLSNHDQKWSWVEWFFGMIFIRMADVVITHGYHARDAVSQWYALRQQNSKIRVVPHPNYIDAYPINISREEAQLRLHINSSRTQFLFFGLVRPYKGILELLEAVQSLPTLDADVWIVGDVSDPDLEQKIKDFSQFTANVHCMLDFVADDDLAVYFQACDAVVLPYKKILTSGAAVLAMSFGKPCIVPRLGCLPEILDDEGAFFYDSLDSNGLKNALTKTVESRSMLKSMGEHNFEKSGEWTWDMAAERIQSFYTRERSNQQVSSASGTE